MTRPLRTALVALALAGCDAAPGGDPSVETGDLLVLNDLAVSIVEVNLAPCSAPAWRPNAIPMPLRTAADGRNGDAARLTAEVGCWNVRAIDELGGEATLLGAPVLAGQTTTWAVERTFAVRRAAGPAAR